MTARAPAGATTCGGWWDGLGCVAVSTLAAVFPVGATAAQWEVTPNVSVRQAYVDNVDQTPSNEQHDLVTELRPGVVLRGTGRRLNVDLAYNLQGLESWRDVQDDEISHQLAATSRAELVAQRLFLDASASIRQENVSNEGRRSTSTLSGREGQTDVYTLRIGPTYRQRLGGYADLELRYRFDKVDNSGEIGSESHSFGGVMTSGARLDDLPWSLSANHSVERSDDGTEDRFRDVEASGQYKLNRRWGLVAGVGYEDNSYDTSTGDDESGFTYRAGVVFTPSSRTRIEAGYRDRAFGGTFYADAEQRLRRTVFSLSYSEELTTSSQLQADRPLLAPSPFGDPVPISTDPLAQVPTDTPRIGSEVIRQRRLDASLAWRGRRTNATLGAFADQREFQRSGDSEDGYGLRASATRNIWRDASLTGFANWERTEPATTASSDLVAVGLSFTRRLGGGFGLSLEAARTEQSSDDPDNEYTEHRVSVLLSKTF